MYIRLAYRLLVLSSFVPVIGCSDGSTPFVEQKIGDYDYQVSSDPNAEPTGETYTIEDNDPSRIGAPDPDDSQSNDPSAFFSPDHSSEKTPVVTKDGKSEKGSKSGNHPSADA